MDPGRDERSGETRRTPGRQRPGVRVLRRKAMPSIDPANRPSAARGPANGHDYDAVVVGSGPNGLAAAIELARNGRSVLVVEGADTVGGSCRSAPLTLPGFVHDTCAAVMALARSSPFLRSIPLADQGLELADPPAAVAHPFDDGTAAVLEPGVQATASGLSPDAGAYAGLFGPLVRDWEKLSRDLLAPPRLPGHPIALTRFGMNAIRSAKGLADRLFTA